jgi:hypothetical protein
MSAKRQKQERHCGTIDSSDLEDGTTVRGSVWRKWDLHVHTPDSMVQHYGGEFPWPRFIDELEALPDEFSVIGINDYWFLDGYEKIIDEKRRGRLRNIDCVFPVIEMRINQFAGTQDSLNRINLHVIFDPAIDVNVIREQFITALTPSFQISAGEEGDWSGRLTRESLEDYGRKIIDSVPLDRRHQYGSPLKEGFNNLVVSLEQVIKALDSHYFRNRFVLALGKVKWAKIKWNDGSIGTKKNLINRASLIFTAFEDPSVWQQQRGVLLESQVMANLIDCSDAHTWSDSTESNRIGNCYTWFRSVPNFGGLLHVIEEFDSRVFVGVRPPELVQRDGRPESIIDRIHVGPSGEIASPIDYEVELNPRFVVVVGNKGQGKSAFLDFIARGANSSRDQHFAFLTQQRFLRPKNSLAEALEVTLTWANGLEQSVPVSKRYDPGAVEQVEYLPQSLIEKVCSSDAYSTEGKEFEAELRRVLFGHLSVEEREGATTFQQVLDARLNAFEPQLQAKRTEIRQLSNRYQQLIVEASDLDIEDISRREKQILEFLAVANRERVVAVVSLEAAAGSEDPDVKAIRDQLSLHEDEYHRRTLEVSENRAKIAGFRAKSRELTGALNQVDVLKAQSEALNADLRALTEWESEDQLLHLSVKSEVIESIRKTWAGDSVSLESKLETGLSESVRLQAEIGKAVSMLQAVDGDRERRRSAVTAIDQRIKSLIGDESDVQSLAGIRSRLQRALKLPGIIMEVREQIVAAAGEVYELLMHRLRVLEELYRPAAVFIERSPLAADVGIEFAATLALSESWGVFAEMLDGRRNPALLSHLEYRRTTLDEPTISQVAEFVDGVLERLSRELGDIKSETLRDPRSALKKSVTLSDFVYLLTSLEWMDPRLSLTRAGEPLEQLSPGQRGLVLLLFYLLVDGSYRPLLLDQPEENLDNAAVKHILVPAIQEACSRRQVILVTHNANLAIVGDADQILHASITDERSFSVTGGGLPDPASGEASIDILEGARPAFANRRNKYERVIRPE